MQIIDWIGIKDDSLKINTFVSQAKFFFQETKFLANYWQDGPKTDDGLILICLKSIGFCSWTYVNNSFMHIHQIILYLDFLMSTWASLKFRFECKKCLNFLELFRINVNFYQLFNIYAVLDCVTWILHNIALLGLLYHKPPVSTSN